MGAFKPLLDKVGAQVQRVKPGSQGIYALPWYVIIGEPKTGRSSVVKAAGLTWPLGDEPIKHADLGSGWVSGECAILEPGSSVVGQGKQHGLLGELARDLRSARPREAVDGALIVLRVADLADLEDEALEAFAKRYRDMLVELGVGVDADVPCYLFLTGYDTLWGFEDVFVWTAGRAKEDPWGFTLPADTPSQDSVKKIHEELDGLGARLESMCFHRLQGEDPIDVRVRVYQHLAEAHALVDKLKVFFKVVFQPNAYERAPWMRAMTIGAAVPGMGERPRAGVKRFLNMGLALPPPTMRGARPGGLPLHFFMKTTVLPESELVPLKKRWRDDTLTVVLLVLGILTMIGGVVVMAVLVSGKT